MTNETDQRKEKRPVCISPFFYVCMGAGIVIMSMVLDFGESMLAAGLECGIGALLGGSVFYGIRWCVSGYEPSEKDEQKQ